MDIDSATDVVKEEHLPEEETDNSCIFEYFEIVPLARDTDGSYATNDVKEEPLQVEETDDSYRLKITEVVSLARDTGGSCTTECVSGDWSAEVKQESLAVVKQEPHDVCVLFVYHGRKKLLKNFRTLGHLWESILCISWFYVSYANHTIHVL